MASKNINYPRSIHLDIAYIIQYSPSVEKESDITWYPHFIIENETTAFYYWFYVICY